ncbi:conserved membrane hypothetical protein [Gammaproteobacteria bacterium]
MRNMLKILISTLVLMLGVVSLPATAATPGEGFQKVALTSNDIKHMTLGQAAAIVGGAIVGGSVTDMVLDGTVFTILGVVAGAVLGNEWYDRGMWPFQ